MRLLPIKVGIGTTRFPKNDREGSVDLFRTAIDSGMNHIDASRSYWDIELLLAKVLKDGYREKVELSSKWSPWMMKEGEPTEYYIRKNIEESLKRLEVDYLDHYLIWHLSSRENFKIAMKKGGMVDGLLKARDEGLVKKIGYSTHDTPENAIKSIKETDWQQIIMFSYNLLNQEFEEAIWQAYSKGIFTVVMNPLGGGSFLRENSFLKALSDEIETESVADLGIRFLASNKNIHMILSGISKESDIVDTLSSAKKECLTFEQMERIRSFIKDSKNLEGFCTSCGYCLPCPVRINIPSIMNCIFLEKFNGNKEESIKNYSKIEGARGDACIKCKKCENVCTQNLKIVDGMEHASKYYLGEK